MEKRGWFWDSIGYQVFLDRFNTKKTHQGMKPVWAGGTIKGVTEKIPYLKDLGVDCIFLSPFMKTVSYHGYTVTDFFNIEPRFGTKDDLKKLVETAHKNGMKVIADFVANHCSKFHPFFEDARRDPESTYRDWFIWKKWPYHYVRFLEAMELPKLNLKNKATKDHMISSAVYWMTEFKLDGYRLDHAIGPAHSFWEEFAEQVRACNRDAVLIGEVWLKGVKWHHLETINMKGKHLHFLHHKLAGVDIQEAAMKRYSNVLDGCLDFTANKLLRSFIAKEELTAQQFMDSLVNHYEKFPSDFFLPVFLDNHDMNRFLFDSGNNVNKMKIGALISFTLYHPPIIYYGDEVGLSQSRSIEEGTDIEAREIMEWKKQDAGLLEHYKKLSKLRKNNPALRKGGLRVIHADKESSLLAYTREIDDRKVLIMVNPSSETKKMHIDLKKTDLRCDHIEDLFSGKKEKSQDVMRFELGPYGFRVVSFVRRNTT